MGYTSNSSYKVIAATGGCGGGSCPTVYEDQEGNVLVQGSTLTPEETAAVAASVGLDELPAGETLVRIPKAIFDAAGRSRV